MITKKDYEADLRKFRDFCRKNPFLMGCYVYVLVDPRGEREQVFYVGKGTNDRMFQHVLESFKASSVGSVKGLGEKLDRINKIHDAGYKVKMYILHYGLTDEHAFIVESVLIDVFRNFQSIDSNSIGDLTNSINGFDHRRGFCNTDSLYRSHGINEYVKILPTEKILLIRISGTGVNDNDIYERVRKHWRLNPEHANKATYIAACRNGIVVGLYKNISGWLPSDIRIDPNNVGRFYFEGCPITDMSVCERYLYRIVDIPKGTRYPVIYLKGW